MEHSGHKDHYSQFPLSVRRESCVESFPAIHSEVFSTERKILYLKHPGVVLISKPITNLTGILPFLQKMKNEECEHYLEDPDELSQSALLTKFAGQTCYASFGKKRTKNDQAEKYFNNIRDSGHGSVFEHANFSFFIYGVSRSCTHEIIRHRAGFAYSQLSQRYVSESELRFVERPEYQQSKILHTRFEDRIYNIASDYSAIISELKAATKTTETKEARTAQRKKVNQAARSILTNETESFLVMTGNTRAWRNFIEQRCSLHADVEIRELAFRIYLCLAKCEPLLFGDYAVIELDDMTHAVETRTRKV